MEIYEGFETVKQKLIIAGMQEIENHGITDFSLRRVASICNVSCAAPYKHFKSKEDFIAQIAIYIHKQWSLLQNQISSIFSDNPQKQLTEICIAYIRFWIANPNFRSVLMLKPEALGDSHNSVMSEITEKIGELLCVCPSFSSQDEKKKKAFMIRSLLYGATSMIDNGEIENGDKTINMIKECIENLL